MRHIKLYPRDFKIHVCKLVLDKKAQVPQLAELVNVPSHTIYRWLNEYRSYGDDAFVGSGYVMNPEAKLKRLQKMNQELQAEINLLKKLKHTLLASPKNSRNHKRNLTRGFGQQSMRLNEHLPINILLQASRTRS